MKTIALCSMLHENANINSATRRFRGEPVLNWTLRRITQVRNVQGAVILAWDDQLDALSGIDVSARACGTRRPNALLQATTAAQHWAEGWRGGLNFTSWFDKGFVGSLAFQALTDESADAVLWVDPASGLVDPAILAVLIDAAEHGSRDFYFTQAAPGLGGVLLKRDLLLKLADNQWLPGRLVHYLPDSPVVDPITSDACIEVPLPVSRTIDRFALDSQRQINRIEQATRPLNGTLMTSEALSLANRVAAMPSAGAFPRELVIELSVRRLSSPVFSPITHLPIDRCELSLANLSEVIAQATVHDDVRVTLAGVGDPLCHSDFDRLLDVTRAAAAVSIETDLIGVSEDRLKRLVDSGIDAIAIHLPSMQPATYKRVMGVDAMAEVLENIRKLVIYRQKSGNGIPLIVPIFQKLAMNLEEMELWYDTWLRALGSAVIRGPSIFGGRLPVLAAADMTPNVRKPCSRIQQRMTILSDGSITMCEEDVAGEFVLGNVKEHRIADLWTGAMEGVREQHKRLASLPVLCGNCREWYRP